MQYQITPEKWQQIKDDPAIVEAIQKGATIVAEVDDMVEVSCASAMAGCDCWRCVIIDKVWDLVLSEVIQDEESDAATN